MRPERLRLIGWLGAVAWGGLIFWLSSTPDAGGVLGFLPTGSDKVLHGVAFLVLAGLLTVATGRPVVATALAVAYGVSDEVHQLFVPGRTADVADLVADALGAAAGAMLVGYLLRREENPTLE
ncbi:MAG TPA: VanZ family protein [Trueperaceae bacterium]|nr:VanZ family protein [Trueperaceae bacterium]